MTGNTADQNIANDYKVVSFHNRESFDFTPAMGCMYDGRTVNGSSGKPGIEAGETKVLPYHVGYRLAVNLAKQAMIQKSGNKQEIDSLGNPMVKSMWDDEGLENRAGSYVTEMYQEDAPTKQTETDRLFARIAALEALIGGKPVVRDEEALAPIADAPVAQSTGPVAEGVAGLSAGPLMKDEDEGETAPTVNFQDKAEVIAELEKRGVQHDKRASKASLEALLA